MTDDSLAAYRGPPATSSSRVREAVEGLVRSASNTVEENQLVDVARKILKVRLETAKLFPKDLFRDSAWDMMLELFISGEEGGLIYVKQLIVISGESSTAAMRRIDRLEEARFIGRRADAQDHRRVVISLTARGRAAMIAMLRRMAELPLAKLPATGPVSFEPYG
jgi:DNA-binding MarR family transcriptional regulator